MKTSVTKKAYARGIGESLQQCGVIQFPSNEVLKQASDHASELISVEPTQNHVSNEDCVKVASYLGQYNDQLRQANKTASFPQSVSLAVDGRTAFGDLLQKVASDVMGQPGGGTPTAVGMADHSNNLNAAAQETDLGAKEKKERPEGYAHVGQGNTNIGEGAGANIGKEQDHPKKPKPVGGASSNSVTQASKSAGLNAILQKMAEGQPGGGIPTAVGMADHSNDLSAAAQETDLGAKEQGERPDGYAVVGQGNANIGESANANIGEEQDHPGKPNDAVGENSVTMASKSAANQKIAQARAAGQNSVESLLNSLSQSFG